MIKMKNLQILLVKKFGPNEMEKTINEALEMLQNCGNQIHKINYFISSVEDWKVVIEYYE